MEAAAHVNKCPTNTPIVLLPHPKIALTVQEVYLNRANCISVCLTVDEVYLNQTVLLVDGTQVVYL